MAQPRDYFAELYVAGLFADAGWNVYFPHRDRGMDFIVSKTAANGMEIIRSVQVKGKYPELTKGDKQVYGFIGRLNQLHPDMVLAIPFFESESLGPALFVAYMPFPQIRRHPRGFRCEPARFRSGRAEPRREYRRYCDREGLEAAGVDGWGVRSHA